MPKVSVDARRWSARSWTTSGQSSPALPKASMPWPIERVLEEGGRTIGVIGTPLTSVYPKQNAALQEKIAQEHLLISQVPFKRYSEQDFRLNRSFFPERNVTMSALSDATIIVEASDTSGTLYQARAALRQKRKLFILNNCFENASLKWPAPPPPGSRSRERSVYVASKMC